MKGNAVRDLAFRKGETGFVFYDDRGPFSGRAGEPARAWAFSTIKEAATWLFEQFADEADHDVPTPTATESSYADTVRRYMSVPDEEGAKDRLLEERLRLFTDDMKVQLYAGDVRSALNAARGQA